MHMMLHNGTLSTFTCIGLHFVQLTQLFLKLIYRNIIMKYIAIKLQDGICLSFIFEDNVLYHILLCPFPIFDNKQQNTM